MLTAKGQATRDRIVAAAADLIFEQGVTATSMSDVRGRANVSGSQLSHYFTCKDELVRAVVTYRADYVVETQRAMGDLGSMEGLRRWSDALVAKQHKSADGCEFGSLAGELRESEGPIRSELACGFDRQQELLHDALIAMRESGELRPDADPDELALALLAAAQGGSLLTQTQRDTRPLEAALRGALAYVESFAT